MKKLFKGALFLAIIGTVIVGCEKEEVNPAIESISQTSMNDSKSSNQNSKAMDVVYGNNSCTLANGETGCKCEIVQDNDDCSLQTDCKAESELHNYSTVLHSMFTPAEIENRAANGTRITEPELREALVLDGFPLK